MVFQIEHNKSPNPNDFPADPVLMISSRILKSVLGCYKRRYYSLGSTRRDPYKLRAERVSG